MGLISRGTFFNSCATKKYEFNRDTLYKCQRFNFFLVYISHV